MTSSNGPSASQDINKLTVPQLKALCKERRITGYSKLNKTALLQKLAEVAASTDSNGLADATPAPVITPTSTTDATTTAHRERNVAHQSATTAEAQSMETSITKTALLTTLPVLSANRTEIANTTSSTKRPAHTDNSPLTKRSRTSLEAAQTGHESPIPSATAFQSQVATLPPHSAFKVPQVPAKHRGRSLHGSSSSILAIKHTVIGKSSVTASRQIAGGPGRFKPLVVSRPELEPDTSNKVTTRAPSVTVKAIDFAPFPDSHRRLLPTLSHISFPPKASERKWVNRWAIILSALSPADREACMLVSRTIRYAVHLSAIHILSNNYAGRRLDAVLEQYTRNMTNYWPYLRFRMDEVTERRRAFKRSFLGQYINSIGYEPLTNRLWTSPDDEKQVDVAIRFVLTRMWFAVSVGAYGHDASAWWRCIVQDVREVVKGEVWQIVARDDDTNEDCYFYVLEATCEVIGQSPSSQGESTPRFYLRTDWTAWIDQQSRAPPDSRPGTLLDHVKWSNAEDYYQGVSKVWLRRVQGQDADNVAKKSVARKYILASVVANGISGPWMSTSAMAQEFAGLPNRVDLDARAAGRSANMVNMYLPAHHHVESIHFTTSKGETLHEAVAVVQTPGREYYVLRDNGMQIGCEEEGIPRVWQKIVGCDVHGRALVGTHHV